MKFCIFVCKILCKKFNRSDKIPKSFRGAATFYKHPVHPNINTTSRRTTSVVNRAWSLSHCRCSQQLSTECDGRNLFTIIVRCVDDTKVEQDEGPASFCSAIFLFLLLHFYSAMLCIARTMLSQDVCPSARLSVCLSHASILSKRLNISSNVFAFG